MKIFNFLIFLFLILFASGGCDKKTTANSVNPNSKVYEKKISRLISPKANARYIVGDEIQISLAIPDTCKLDSVQLFYQGKIKGVFQGLEDLTLSTSEGQVGKSGIRVKLFYTGGKKETHSRQVELLSDLVPQTYAYRISKQYNHDAGAYTQGLLYHDGWLYEGTGNENQSTVRKVRLSNGEVIQIRNNASNIFGEGITIFNGKIYQLTYRAQICFVYDLNTFEEINRFYYQNKEGWGLTNTDTELIMSDGTNIVYFLDPELFTVNRQIEVYDEKGPVDSLNEMEFINGKIYANRYYTDEIVIIDPVTGKVEKRVNLRGILPAKERKPSTNVLNGIAWDKDGDRLFVTGKYWPKLYEIELVKK